MSHPLLDKIKQDFELKNDAALVAFLDANPPQISRIRTGTLGVSGDLKIVIHKKTGWPITRIESLIPAAA